MFILSLFGAWLSLIPAEAESFHTAAKKFETQTVRPFPTTQKPWSGYFSATNFGKKDEQLELKKIKTSLRAAIVSMPKSHTHALKDLKVQNQKHKSRGMANDKKMILNTRSVESQKELMAVFVHELGHIVDLGHLAGKGRGKTAFYDGKTPIVSDDPSSQFYTISWQSAKSRKSSATRKDFVSGYAMSNIFEDFAETYLFYRLHGDKFRSAMSQSEPLAQKYAFMKTQVFHGQEFQKNQKNTAFQHGIIFDTTLLPYSAKNFLARD